MKSTNGMVGKGTQVYVSAPRDGSNEKWEAPFWGTVVKTPMSQAEGYVVRDNKTGIGYDVSYDRVHTSVASSKTAGMPLDKQFEAMEDLVTMVVNGITPSVMIFGAPGVGKTHRVRECLKQCLKIPDVDYVFVKGHSTPMGLYTTLHNNRDSIVIFDDCDAVFKDAVATGILKAALDSYDTRTVSWCSKAVTDAGLESKFEFKGSIIFISNLDENAVDDAVRSRAYCINISVTTDQMIDLMERVMPRIETDMPREDKEEVLSYLKSSAGELPEVNLRTLIKSLRLKKASNNWKDMLKFV